MSRPSFTCLCSFSAPRVAPVSAIFSRLSRRAMTSNVPDEKQRLELARIIENLSGQVHAFADVGGREAERVGSLEQVARSIQEDVQDLSLRQGTGGTPPAGHMGSNSFVGAGVVPESLTNKTGLEKWSRWYNFLARAEDDSFNTVLDSAEALEMNAPTIVPGSSGVVDAQTLAQHIYESLLVSTESGAKAHSIVGHKQQASLHLMSRVWKPPKGNIDNTSFLLENGRDGAPTVRMHPPTSTDRRHDVGNHDGHAPTRVREAPCAHFRQVWRVSDG